MDDAERVLATVSVKIREVMRLMSIDVSNKDECLVKVDSCLRHIDGIRGMVEASRLVNVEESLRTLRNQLVIEEQQAPRMVNGDASLRAPRTQSGKLKRCGTWSAPSDSPRPSPSALAPSAFLKPTLSTLTDIPPTFPSAMDIPPGVGHFPFPNRSDLFYQSVQLLISRLIANCVVIMMIIVSSPLTS